MSAGSSFARGITIPRVSVIFLILIAIFFFRDTWLPTESVYRSHSDSPPEKPIQPTESEPEIHRGDNISGIANGTAFQDCLTVPGADKVMLMLKTGATELYQKLPTHVVTTFTCVPHFMIFSDLEQSFGDIPVYDAIAPVSRRFREEHEDFELYRKLQQYQREGQDMHMLQGGGGWNLDKWKFLPMLHQAFESAPEEIEWFVMMEADTSISWTNLLQWLHTMSPKQPFYLGSQNVIGQTTFAHGGSGVVISRRAADMMRRKRAEVGTAEYDEYWEDKTSKSCCGDEIVARALLDADVPLTPAWPIIQGETVSTIDWKEEHWCTPAITWHHVTPIEIDAMFQFEMAWVDDHGWNEPYLFRDVHNHFISRHITVNRTSWNNLSKDKKFVASSLQPSEEDEVPDFYDLQDFEQEAVKTPEACVAACEKHEKCVQWMHSPGRCYLGEVMRFGKSDERESDHWSSGWMQDRIEAFEKHLEGCRVRWHG